MTATVYTSGAELSEGLKGEAQHPPGWSRDEVTIASGENLKMLTVVGKETATGHYKILAPAAADGTEAAAGFVIDDYDATNGVVRGVIISRQAYMNPDKLVWPDGITAPQKTAAIAELEALGIRAKEVV